MGCMHKPLPNLPDNWQGIVIDPTVLDDKEDIASMHVMIMYGPSVCNHTASRYYCPGKGALFWDPGGGYGREGFVKIDKAYNVVIDNIPTVNDYLFWRTKIQTSATEIFVWEGKDKEEAICELYDLMAAASQGDRLNGFDSAIPGLFCSAATSEFLKDHASKVMQVDKWGMPHNLSKQLHELKSADKIYIVENDSGLIKQYSPE